VGTKPTASLGGGQRGVGDERARQAHSLSPTPTDTRRDRRDHHCGRRWLRRRHCRGAAQRVATTGMGARRGTRLRSISDPSTDPPNFPRSQTRVEVAAVTVPGAAGAVATGEEGRRRDGCLATGASVWGRPWCGSHLFARSLSTLAPSQPQSPHPPRSPIPTKANRESTSAALGMTAGRPRLRPRCRVGRTEHARLPCARARHARALAPILPERRCPPDHHRRGHDRRWRRQQCRLPAGESEVGGRAGGRTASTPPPPLSPPPPTPSPS